MCWRLLGKVRAFISIYDSAIFWGLIIGLIICLIGYVSGVVLEVR